MDRVQCDAAQACKRNKDITACDPCKCRPQSNIRLCALAIELPNLLLPWWIEIGIVYVQTDSAFCDFKTTYITLTVSEGRFFFVALMRQHDIGIKYRQQKKTNVVTFFQRCQFR